MEPEFENMTLNEYLMYLERRRDLERSCTSRNIITCSGVAPVKYRNLVYLDSDEEDEEYCNLPSLLPWVESIRKMEHEVPNRCDDNTDYEDSDQEDRELPDLPTFSATNEFASVCEQVEEKIDVNITRKLEEVQVEDIEMDEDYDIYHSNTKETL
nr:hypothetical protein [Tanacetum cinerariifolium]